jgi:tRNA (mo5U34)-methyltransferase
MKIDALGPWFHNLHLPDGRETAPSHFLGDFPRRKWLQIEKHIPEDLRGWECLDIGCNAGFYSFELAKRGAHVLGIDTEPLYLNQAKWAANQFQLKNSPTFKQMQIHELAQIERKFDLVLFMGVFYHLRYPTLALDTVSRLVKKMMIFQTLTSEHERDSTKVFSPAEDYDLLDRDVFNQPGWPRMSFIENKFSGDPTNWWIPNHAAALALLRSTGFSEIEKIAHEIYLCVPPESGVETNRDWSHDEWFAATGGNPMKYRENL